MKTIGDTSKWWSDGGDKKIRFNYNLNENSVVFDLGAYDGSFAEEIINKYNPKVYCFEPINEYTELLKTKFVDNDNVKIYNNAISNKNGIDKMYFNGNSSTIHVKTNNVIEINCITLDRIMKDNNISKIDLIKINIEGEEYNLLEYMISKNLLIYCNNIQVQFHIIINDYINRYENIVMELNKTHELTYRYPFVWENWKLK